jgi:hypothetical protein
MRSSIGPRELIIIEGIVCPHPDHIPLPLGALPIPVAVKQSRQPVITINPDKSTIRTMMNFSDVTHPCGSEALEPCQNLHSPFMSPGDLGL